MNQPNPISPNYLSEKEQKAIELKYEGQGYSKIEEAIGVPIATLKDWLNENGILRLEYEEYTQEQNELRMDEASKIIKQNMPNAAKVLVDLLTSEDDKIRLRAATKLLGKDTGQTDKHIKASLEEQYRTKFRSMTKEELVKDIEITLQQFKNEQGDSNTTFS